MQPYRQLTGMRRFGDYSLTLLDLPPAACAWQTYFVEKGEQVNAKRFTPTAIALGLFCFLLLALPAQAQEFRGHTCENLWEHIRAGGWVIFGEPTSGL